MSDLIGVSPEYENEYDSLGEVSKLPWYVIICVTTAKSVSANASLSCNYCNQWYMYTADGWVLF